MAKEKAPVEYAPTPKHADQCPFAVCIGKATKLELLRIGIEYAVYCRNCGSQGPNGHNEGHAIDLWNERRPTAPPAGKHPYGAKLAGIFFAFMAWMIRKGF